MQSRWALSFGTAIAIFLLVTVGFSADLREGKMEKRRCIATSDTILSGMIASLLPPQRYVIDAILPPGQCPGHYDVKLSDIEKIQRADLVVSFRGMPFMHKADSGGSAQLFVDSDNRNWMAPVSYLYGLGFLADKLSKLYPDDKDKILSRREEAVRNVREVANSLVQRIKRNGLFGKPVLASSMQKEPLEWMGFQVIGEYGRPEAMSAREVIRLAKLGRERQAVAVVDNLQSGPDAGKGISETLGIPHVVLTNFPSERGYLATLGENMDAITAALRK
jgi:zinc transport system substrate-binding protein